MTNTYELMREVSENTFRTKVFPRANSKRKYKAANMLHEFATESRADLTTGLLLCNSPDVDLEKEFKKVALEHVYESMGVPFIIWLLVRPFVMWAIEQLIKDLLTA